MMNRAQRRAARRRQPGRGTPDPMGGLKAIDLSVPMGDFAGTHLVMIWQAFRDCQAGTTDHGKFGWLVLAMRTGAVRAEDIDPLLEQTFAAATSALADAQGIHARHGRYGFTGPGQQAVTAALDAYEAVCRASSAAQMRHAMREATSQLQREKAEAA